MSWRPISGEVSGVRKPARTKGRVGLFRTADGIGTAVHGALEYAGISARVRPGTRVALKPNLTYPWYKPGVTTSPEVIRAVVAALRDLGARVAIVESDGGYGAWKAEQAFEGHGLPAIARELGAEVVNLGLEPREALTFEAGGLERSVPVPTRLLRETDLLVSMPVPKIHANTVLSLALKNQWGCIPDAMRLRMHHVFTEAILAINRRLQPAVLADGTWFLDRNGPMEGVPVEMGLVVGASDVWSFDLYAAELMGVGWRGVPHLKRAVREGDMPPDLGGVECNVAPREASARPFTLRRTPRNYIALAGFHSRFLTWFGYECWFGRVVLHALLYTVAGKPPWRENDSKGEGNG